MNTLFEEAENGASKLTIEREDVISVMKKDLSSSENTSSGCRTYSGLILVDFLNHFISDLH